MNIQKESKIYRFQADYVNGTGEHGDIHKEYAKILEQYKALFLRCPVFSAIGLEDLYTDEKGYLKKGVVTDGILLAVSLLGLAAQSRIMWCVLAFIAACVKWWQVEDEKPSSDNPWDYDVSFSLVTGKSGRWGFMVVAMAAFGVISVIPGVKVGLAWFIYSIPFLIDLCKRLYRWKIAPKKAWLENKKSILAMRQAENGLEEVRKEIRALLPKLQEEYQEGLRQLLSGLPKEERQPLMRQYGILPEHFWWEVNLSEILEGQMLEESIRESTFFSHEIAVFERKEGKEFQEAGKNYAPMLSEKLTLDEADDIYQKNKRLVKERGGVILDFVDCVKYLDIVEEQEIVKDYDYAENAFSRAYMKGEWDSLGNDIEEAHDNEIFSDGKYKNLRSRYDNMNQDVRSYINRKVEVGEHVETYNKMKVFGACQWTGQALLLHDTEVAGGYILLDYRCRAEYDIDNLSHLNGSIITGILPDYVFGEQQFIAKVQRMILEGNCWRASMQRIKKRTGK